MRQKYKRVVKHVRCFYCSAAAAAAILADVVWLLSGSNFTKV